MGYWYYDGNFKTYDSKKKVFYKSLRDYIDRFSFSLKNVNKGIDIPEIHDFLGFIEKTLNDMYDDKDKKYFNYFEEVYFSSNEQNKIGDIHGSRIFGNKSYDSYIFNLYIILLAYAKANKNNKFENFKAVVNDVSRHNMYVDLESFPKGDSFHNFCEMTKFIVNRRDYKDMPNLRRFLARIMINVGTSSLNEFKEIYNNIKKIYDDAIKHRFSYKNELSMIVDKVLGNSFDCLCDNYFYDEILLYEDRFFYVNDKLFELEYNQNLRRDIFSSISKFSVNLFKELNKDNDKDSFRVCMDVVFDSDSYRELDNKLKALVEASELYDNGEREKALLLVREINSDRYIDEYCGKKVSYPNNTMNRVVKPKTIIGRMKDLYRRIDDSISYDFMDLVHVRAKNIKGFYKDLKQKKSQEKGFVKKIGTWFKK